MEVPNPFYTSPVLGTAVTLGNLAIWYGLGLAVLAVAFYWSAMLRLMRLQKAAAVAAGSGEPARGKKRLVVGKGSVAAAEAATERSLRRARACFYATAFCVVVASACLWTLIFGQHYAVRYVAQNTNDALPFGYRLAAFWANQEGTFLLWGFLNSVLGILLIRRAPQDEPWVMPFLGFVSISLFTLLTFMNPFWLTPAGELREVLRNAGAPESILAQLPSNIWEHLRYYFGWGKYISPKLLSGHGLNEQLQNFWMVIHPPTLFVGYSSMMVPSCFALGALMRRDYDSWANRAMPWLAFGWVVLGTGIFLGGYWAYETLGWGGYWAWDPVENASLIPWVVGTALLHGLLAQRARGNFKQANLFLGLMTGCAVLLGSFLVRSGVLDGVSVHSFASPQKSVFFTLLAILVLWFGLSVALWFWRFRDIQSEIAYEQVWERHFGFFLGLIVLTASALVITFGVTMPIWRPWLGATQRTVEHTFYNKALLPVAFVMVLLMTLTPLMPWRQARENPRPMRPFNVVMLVLCGLVTLFFLAAAVHAWQGGFRAHNADPPSYVNDPAYIAFALALALGLVANSVVLVRAARGGLLNTGPWLAHIGFLVMLGGVVWTTRFKTIHSFTQVEVGEAVTLGSRQFIFRGEEPAKGPHDRDRMRIDMVEHGKVHPLRPKLFFSERNNGWMAWPAIVHRGLDDIYVEPSGIDRMNAILFDGLERGETAERIVQRRKNDPQDVVQLTFEGLDMADVQRVLQTGERRPMRIYAEAKLSVNGVEKRVRPALELELSETGGFERRPIPLRVEGLNQGVGYSLIFSTNMDPKQLSATFSLVPDEAVPQGHFQVMYIPGIQVLWWGCYLMFLGGWLVWLRRRRLARQPAKG